MARKQRPFTDAQPRTGDRIHISTYVTPEVYAALEKASQIEQRSLSRLLAWGGEAIATVILESKKDELDNLLKKHRK